MNDLDDTEAERELIEQLAPTPRWYRWRFALLALAIAGAATIGAGQLTGFTTPKLNNGGSASTTFADPTTRDGAKMELLIENDGRFPVTINSVGAVEGVEFTIREAGSEHGPRQPSSTALPAQIHANEAIWMTLEFGTVNCDLVNPDRSSLSLNVSPPVGPNRTVDFEVPVTTQRDGAPSSYSFTGGVNPYELGWPAQIFARACPELTA